MNYGFVVNNSTCIGCHACSTACKSENDVAVGVHRTWVKVTETGQYPDARRNFQVTRCNHCANPPCVRICPTSAMYQRDDGIVEFDTDACIGCKGCMQACPYDAIHIDPVSHTAAKCHFCAHRVDVGLEPACVVVCPEHAIIAGDLDDPTSEISKAVAKHNVTVRKPEQGTAPKVFYIEGNELALHPTASIRPESMMFADVDDSHHMQDLIAAARIPQGSSSTDLGTPIRTPGTQGLPPAGPLANGGSMAEHMVQVGYNAQHRVQWHWQIPAYIVTKHIAGGIYLALAAAALIPALPFSTVGAVFGGALSLLMTLVTLSLLLVDLERPDRFFFLLVRPQWRSWIARAAWILTTFSLVSTVWWGAETLAWLGFVDASVVASVRPVLAVVTAPLALATAIYTAFLFAQCEGRDLWQSPHLPLSMTVHAFTFGGGAFAALAPFIALPPAFAALSTGVFTWGLVASLAMLLFTDLGMPHASEVARQAARDITHGRFRHHFWWGGVALGHLVPVALMLAGVPWLAPLALLCAGLGLFAYELAYVTAPQHIPNS